MNNDLLHTIEETIAGEVSITPAELDYYATDGSVFELKPTAIVFPKDMADVQALVGMAGVLRSQGDDTISLTARGNGTDQGGGPINTGIIVDFMRHMNQILEVGNGYAVVQPGCNYEHLQNELKKTGQYIPAYPASVSICTIGGAVANNSAGEKTIKYGATRKYVEALQVVLADGKAIWIYPLRGQELEQKKQLPTLEGAIYRNIDQLINDNYEAIHNDHPHVTKESAGYALWEVKHDGIFDLTQLVVGSQGTLCLITAIRLKAIPLPDPSKVALQVSYYNDIERVCEAAQSLHALNPSALEIVDQNLLKLVHEQKPELLSGLLPDGETPAFVLLAEFDDTDDHTRMQKLAEANRVASQHALSSVVKDTPDDESRLWKLRRSAAAVMWTIPGKYKALPIIEDGTVPPAELGNFLRKSYDIFEKYHLKIAIWGHAGDADLHMQPFMDLGSANDRKTIFAVADEFYAMVHRLGGTAAGEHNDSLMRAPYRPLIFGPRLEGLFNEVKRIFDPANIYNPHKKVGVDFNYIKKHLRHEYSIKSLTRLEGDSAQDRIDR